MRTERLTGKTRHRSTWTGKLILQVEVEGEYMDAQGDWSPTFSKWRDAKTVDLFSELKVVTS